jgi:uncharacterized protein (DUF952 family)
VKALLVLLVIDDAQVRAPIQFQNLEGGSRLLPHIYRPLNSDAASNAVHLTPNERRLFRSLHAEP